MGKENGIAKRVKHVLSRRPLMCIWTTRLLSISLGLRAICYRLTNIFSCYIDSTAKITGWSHVKFGINSVVASGTWLNVNVRDTNEPSLIIGDNCFIGRNNFVTVGKSVVFGDYCLTATNCAFIGSSHNISDPNMPYISTGVGTESVISIGANCFFGYGAMVLGSVTVGYGSVIGAGTVVLADVPPLSVVIGNPGRVIKRYSVIHNCWIPSSEYVEEALLNEEQYIANLRKVAGYYPLPISAAKSILGDI